MKNTTILLLLLITFSIAGCSSCKKNVDTSSDNPYGLPNATQEGKNTLGFLLNGQPWTPKGQVGLSANLAIDLDFGYNNGILSISSYRSNANTIEYFAIGVKDSLNFITSFPVNMLLRNGTLGNSRFSNGSCSIDYNNTSVYRDGNLRISKLDKIAKIISGTFNVTLYKNGCTDTIRITEGRFDMKF